MPSVSIRIVWMRAVCCLWMQCADTDLIKRLAGQKQHPNRGQWEPEKKVPPKSDAEEEAEEEEEEQLVEEPKEEVKQYK